MMILSYWNRSLVSSPRRMAACVHVIATICSGVSVRAQQTRTAAGRTRLGVLGEEEVAAVREGAEDLKRPALLELVKETLQPIERALGQRKVRAERLRRTNSSVSVPTIRRVRAKR